MVSAASPGLPIGSLARPRGAASVASESRGWQAAGASVQGASHVREGLPNQDAIAQAATPAATTLALADGHGGARHWRSAVGALLAVDVANEVLQDAAARLDAAEASERAALLREELPTRILADWSAAVAAHLAQAPIGEAEWQALENAEGSAALQAVQGDALLAYGATLLAALVTPRCIALLQLGDGDILAVEGDGTTRRPVPADERLVGNQTTSLCRPGALADFRSVVIDGDAAAPALLLLSTDGYANSFRSDADFLQVGGDFLRMLRDDGFAPVREQLREILQHATQHGSGDDITLGLLLPLPSQASPRDESRSDLLAGLGRRLDAAEQRLGRLRRVLGAMALAVALLGALAWSTREHWWPAGMAWAAGVVAAPPGAASAPPGAASAAARGASGAPGATAAASGASAEAPGLSIEGVHAAPAEQGIAVSARVVFHRLEPGSCRGEAVAYDAQDKRIATGASKPIVPPAIGTDEGGVPVEMLIAYGKDEKRAKVLKHRDVRVAVSVACGSAAAVLSAHASVETP